MSRFEEARAAIERRIVKDFGEQSGALLDFMASAVMLEYYGMELHGKVNDATHRRIFPRITKTNALGLAVQAGLILLSSSPSDPGPQFLRAFAPERAGPKNNFGMVRSGITIAF
jgi:hypothetical protein